MNQAEEQIIADEPAARRPANWCAGPLLAFDTETTGADPKEARIVTASAIKVSSAGVLWQKDWLVNPGIEIPAEATAIHGVTNEMAREKGLGPSTAIELISDTLSDAWKAGCALVAMNARYDLRVLQAERRRLGLQELELGPVLDPQVIDRAVDKYRKGKRKLADLAECYRVKLDGAHSSDGDALAAARVIWRMSIVCEGLKHLTLEQMQEYQARAHAEWAAHYSVHLFMKDPANPGAVIDGSWPCEGASL